MLSDRHFDSDDEFRRYEVLLYMADRVVLRRSVPELFVELVREPAKAFEFPTRSLHSPTKKCAVTHLRAQDIRTIDIGNSKGLAKTVGSARNTRPLFSR